MRRESADKWKVGGAEDPENLGASPRLSAVPSLQQMEGREM